MKFSKEFIKTFFNYFKRNKLSTTIILIAVLFLITPFQCQYKDYKIAKGGIKYLSTDINTGDTK